MRLDLFLKRSSIVKRRTIANELAKNGRVFVNGKIVKPSYDVKEGDIISIVSRTGSVKEYKVIKIPQKQIGKGQWKDYIEIISE